MTLTDELLDEVADVTPEDLRAIRIRIGLQPNELAMLLGLGGRRDIVEVLEKSRTWTIHRGHIETLTKLESTFDDWLWNMLDKPPPRVLITYPNDGVMEEYDQTAFDALRFATVHRMLMATAQKRFNEQGTAVPLQAVIPAKVQDWLGQRDASPEALQAWALQHMGIYRFKDGMPVAGQREE